MEFIAPTVRWLFFCDDDDDCSESGQCTCSPPSCPSDRWRLLLWFTLHTLVWCTADHTWTNVAVAFTCLAVLGLTVTSKITTLNNLRTVVIGYVTLLATNIAISALILMTSRHTYLTYEYLAKKVILRESEMLRRWCPQTCITVGSITGVTCLMRGLHRQFF
ncbi:uncharacterized protein LOC131946036 [Physella acuta]|uniref:uncharacterized protein LOC131946036 n=1 Tax=Physella acuta TaxID=109671 RepID=UPI0027DB2F11|nr:uncharacterized protein LOC131946036 [Physella acuta]XP_059162648.1 uncharacterized protein LOC131946036 [Physella acuta]XP_059162649.1 uncharacterized protein LOC131946036 [Physella acuta]